MTLEEFNLTVDQHSDGVYRFILKNIGCSDRAKDIIQDTYEKLWRKVNDIPFDKAKTYLFTSAYHTMIDHIRKEKNQVDMELIHLSEDHASMEYSNAGEVIEVAAKLLPASQRSVLMLRDYEGYSYQEISEITGLNENQVKVYIFRARVFIKEYLQKVDLPV